MKALASLTLAVFASALTLAQNPDLVPSFGTAGEKHLDFGVTNRGTANDVIFDSNGDIIMIGQFHNGANYDFGAVKVDAETGALIPSFGSNGKAFWKFGKGEDVAYTAVRHGAHIYIAGFTILNGDQEFAIVKIDEHGNLISSFGENGLLELPLSHYNDQVFSILVDESGDVYAAGRTAVTHAKDAMVVIKLNANGQLVSEFGQEGIAILETAEPSTALGMSLDGSSNIILAGYVGNASAIVKLDALGRPVESFGEQGILLFEQANFNGVAVDEFENIYACGEKYGDDYGALVVKVDSNGVLDNNFGLNGFKLVPYMRFSDVDIDAFGDLVLSGTNGTALVIGKLSSTSGAVDINFDGDGIATVSGYYNGQKFVVEANGNVIAVTSGEPFHAVKFNAFGALVTAFDTDGKVEVQVGSLADVPVAGTFDANGNIVIGGFNGQIAMVDATGSAISGFGTEGKSQPVFVGSGVAINDMARVAGNFYLAGSTNTSMIVYKVDETGTLVSAFGNNGMKVVSTGGAYDIAADADGNLLLVGAIHNGTNEDVAVVKVDTTGKLVTAFGVDGKAVIPVGTHYDVGKQLTFTPEGDIIVAGTTYGNGNDDIFVMKLDANGTLVSEFGNGGITTVASSEGYYDQVESLFIDQNGNIFVGAISGSTPAVVKLDPTGALQTNWGVGGIALIAQIGFPNLISITSGIAQDNDGNMYVSGVSGDHWWVAKLNSDGSQVASFGEGAVVMGSASGAQYAYLLIDEFGDLFVVTSDEGDFHVVKLKKATDLVYHDQNKMFGDATFMMTATSSSTGNITYTVVEGGAAAITPNGEVTILAAGTSKIEARQIASDTHISSVVTATLTVSKADQTITFPPIEDRTYGDTTFSLNATASSTFPVTYTSSNPNVATVDTDGLLTIVGAGTTIITAYQSGDDNHHAAPEVAHEFIVRKKNQTITFAAISSVVFGTASELLLEATSTSNLAVGYTTTSENIQVLGPTVTIFKPGSATIIAFQPGDNNFNAAESVSQSFCINPPAPIVTSMQDGLMILNSIAKDGNQWYQDGIALLDSTNQSMSIIESGVYTVTNTVDGCSSEMSEPVEIVVTNAEARQDHHISVYPNPVQNKLTITLTGGFKGVANFEITDTMGRVMLEGQGTSHQTEVVDVTAYEPGMYLVRSNGFFKKFVKQ